MGSKDSSFDVVYRGDTRKWIAPGTYVFFQRLKEHPISLREGMHLLLTIKSQEKDIMKFDDSMDTFMLKGE